MTENQEPHKYKLFELISTLFAIAFTVAMFVKFLFF